MERRAVSTGANALKRCSVGGQAVLEGVMMRTPSGGVALAVRRSDGSIVEE